MTDPKTRALHLVGELTKCVAAATYDFDRVTQALRLAIEEMGEEQDEHCGTCGWKSPEHSPQCHHYRPEREASHTWVPIAECGELADGWYRVLMQGDDHPAPYQRSRRTSYGRFAPVHGTQVTHVLSPHLGPIPEAPCT